MYEYLGIKTWFRNRGSVVFSQYDAIKKIWNILPDYLLGECRKTPAPENAFKVYVESTRLDKEKQVQYHSVTAKRLCFSQRSRTDLQLDTCFHCTRTKEPTDQDCRKFRHSSGHLWLTRHAPLTVSIDDNGEECICIDGAHAAHIHGKGCSKMCLKMGRGAMIIVPNKLGLVTTSSTKTEVVADGECFPKCSWFRYFRLAQGDEAKGDMLMQDNE